MCSVPRACLLLFPEASHDLLVNFVLGTAKTLFGAPIMKKETDQDGPRVTFEHRLPAHMMAIDGTWRRSCIIKDVSETSAILQVESSIEGLALAEFFLLLSSTGLAYRRCQLDRVNGEEIAVNFLRQKARGKKSTKPLSG
jgi:hypothetical protein